MLEILFSFILLFLLSPNKTPSQKNSTNFNTTVSLNDASKQGLDNHTNTDIENVVVKILLVCDKEFGDIFNHSRSKILDYFTVYSWDINNRFNTLSSVRISFVISDLIVINSTKEQHFIEKTRDPKNGKADLNNILQNFSEWVYTNFKNGSSFQSKEFDIGIAVTNTRLKSRGGSAFVGGACGVSHSLKKYYGSIVWSDQGDWGSVTTGAHEIAHNLGAYHDNDAQKCYNEKKGYIMGGGDENLRWYFSNCSDQAISKFLKSKDASCLEKFNGTGASKPNISNGIFLNVTKVLTPTMHVQCQRRLRSPQAFIMRNYTGNCKVMECIEPVKGGSLIWKLPPVDNSPCLGGGRCFRGVCRKDRGQ